MISDIPYIIIIKINLKKILTQVPNINGRIQLLQSKNSIEMTNRCENGHKMFLKGLK